LIVCHFLDWCIQYYHKIMCFSIDIYHYMYIQVKFNLRISCFEIYHENVYDLFADPRERNPLTVRYVYIGYLCRVRVHTSQEMSIYVYIYI
jgi:hypothetical protein